MSGVTVNFSPFKMFFPIAKEDSGGWKWIHVIVKLLGKKVSIFKIFSS